jgi:hypothetical protein
VSSSDYPFSVFFCILGLISLYFMFLSPVHFFLLLSSSDYPFNFFLLYSFVFLVWIHAIPYFCFLFISRYCHHQIIHFLCSSVFFCILGLISLYSIFLFPVHFSLLSSSDYQFYLFFCILLYSWFDFIVFHISVSCPFLAAVIIRLSTLIILLYSSVFLVCFHCIPYFCFLFISRYCHHQIIHFLYSSVFFVLFHCIPSHIFLFSFPFIPRVLKPLSVD